MFKYQLLIKLKAFRTIKTKPLVKTEKNEITEDNESLSESDEMPNLTYDKKSSRFLLTLRGRASIEMTEALRNWELYKSGVYATYSFKEAARFKSNADETAKSLFNRALVKTYSLPSARLPSFLDPHQVEGVRWVLTRSRSYLAHAPGAGKTCEAIVAALYAKGNGPVLFIVPPTLTENWKREIERFTADMLIEKPDVAAHARLWPSVAIVPVSKDAHSMNWDAEFIIVPDSMLSRAWVLRKLMRLCFRFVGVDEASRFKEATSVRTIALFGGKKKDFKSPGLIYSARHAVLLDGSPMPNRAMELWAPVFAMAPETIDFMSERQYGFKYCGAVMNDRGEWEFKHSSHEKELRQRLQKNFMHVVPESVLGHSPRLRSLVFMSEDPRTPDMRNWERRWIHRMQTNPDFDFQTGNARDNQGELATLRRELGERKVPWAATYISERLESGEAVLVFAWHRDVCMALAKRLARFKPGLIIGGTDAGAREEFLTSFQGGKRNLLIMNIAAGGRGHNIQRADRIIFVEPSWTDEQNKQCEKRASRRGRAQDLPVKSDYLVVPDSIDEMVLGAAFTKEARVKRVIG